MAVVLQQDEFDYVSADVGNSPPTPKWRNYGYALSSNGRFAQVVTSLVGPSFRNIFRTFDPATAMPTAVGAGVTLKWQVEGVFTLPATLPTGGQFLELGLVTASRDVGPYSDHTGYELVLSVQGSGAQNLIYRSVSAAGVGTDVFTTVLSVAQRVAAGGTAILRFGFDLRVGFGLVIRELNQFKFPGLTVSALDVGVIAAAPKFSGFVLRGNGPTSGGATPVMGPTRRPTLDAWRLLSFTTLTLLHESPTITAEATPAAVTISDESDASSDVLPVDPTYVMEWTDDDMAAARRFDTEDGHSLASGATNRNRRRSTWNFALNETDRTTLSDFWDDKRTEGTFLWTDPSDSVERRYMFVSLMQFVFVATGAWSASVEVLEVF